MMLSIRCSIANDAELYTNEGLNIIYLIGELHDDDECIKFRNLLKERAKNKEIILAHVGTPFNSQTVFDAFGIEDKYVQVLGKAWEFHTMLSVYKVLKDIRSVSDEETLLMVNSLKDALINIHLSPAWYIFEQMNGIFLQMGKPLLQRYPDPSSRAIIGKFWQLENLRESSPKLHSKRIPQLVKDHSFEKPFFLKLYNGISQWTDLFRDLFEFCAIEVMSNNKDFSLSRMEEASLYMTRFQNYLKMNIAQMNAEELDATLSAVIADANKVFELKEDMALNERGPILLKNIISTFEKNKSQKKPFYVIIGHRLTPLLYEGLRQRGYEVEMNKMGQKTYEKHLLESLGKQDL